jgi:hypothetical protein
MPKPGNQPQSNGIPLLNEIQRRAPVLARRTLGALLRGLPIEQFAATETDWTVLPKTLFAATQSRVYESSDEGDSWQIAT